MCVSINRLSHSSDHVTITRTPNRISRARGVQRSMRPQRSTDVVGGGEGRGGRVRRKKVWRRKMEEREEEIEEDEDEKGEKCEDDEGEGAER